jgi:hypothetical protein
MARDVVQPVREGVRQMIGAEPVEGGRCVAAFAPAAVLVAVGTEDRPLGALVGPTEHGVQIVAAARARVVSPAMIGSARGGHGRATRGSGTASCALFR